MVITLSVDDEKRHCGEVGPTHRPPNVAPQPFRRHTRYSERDRVGEDQVSQAIGAECAAEPPAAFRSWKADPWR